MPKEAPGALPLPRSQHRGVLPQFRPQATHQPPTSYHHVQQYLPRPPGYQYYPTPGTFSSGQADPPTSSAPTSQSSAQANYEHALKMASKFERGALGAAYATHNFKVSSYDQRSSSPSSSPQTSVSSHKPSSYDRTSNALAGYRSSQSVSGSPYDQKMSVYASALPYDRFSKKKLAAHVSEKSIGPYGRNDKKPSRHAPYASSSYDRVKPAPAEGDKGAGRSYYERRSQRQEAERQMDAYDAQSSSPYDRTPSAAPSFERLTTAPTTPYDRLTSTAAYERRAVFDRAYEAAAYDRRLYALTGGIGGSYYAVSNHPEAGDQRPYPESFQACLHIPPCLCHTSASPIAWPPSKFVHPSKLTSADVLPVDQLKCEEPEHPLDLPLDKSHPLGLPQEPIRLSQDPLLPCDTSQEHQSPNDTLLLSSTSQNCKSHSDGRVTCKFTLADTLPSDQPKCQQLWRPWECPLDQSIVRPRMEDVPQDLILSQDPLLPSDSAQDHQSFNNTPIRSSSSQNCISHSADRVTCKLTSADALPKDQPKCQEPDRISQDPIYPSDSSEGSSKENKDPLMPSSQNQTQDLLQPLKSSQKRTDVLTFPLKMVHPKNSECLRVKLKSSKNVLCSKKPKLMISDDSESCEEDLSSAQDPLCPSGIRRNLLHTSCASVKCSNFVSPENHVVSGKRPLSPDLPSNPVRSRKLSRIVKPYKAWSNQSSSPPRMSHHLSSVHELRNQSSSLQVKPNQSSSPPDELNQSSLSQDLPKRSQHQNSVVTCQDLHLPQFANRDRAEEYEAKEPATYPAKPRMSLLTSAEYLSSLSRRTQQSDDGARTGHPSVIVPPSRSPADSSPRKSSKNETLPPLTIDTSSSPKADPEKPSIYMPTVEPISPTSPPDPSGEDGADTGGTGPPKSSAKDSLLVEIARVDREINKIEHHIFNLKRKQSELEQKAKKSETESSEETAEAPLPQHFSLSHKVYSENRRKAKENHAGLSHLGPPVDLPLYNQPSDTSVYQDNKLRHLMFKGRLIDHLRRRRRERFRQEKEMTADYALRTENWNRVVEKMENSPERKRRDVENRELFEKVFPKIRKEREDRERFLRVGSRVKSDADLEEIMDNLHEQEMEVKKMRDYAAVPPLLLSAECRRCVYVNTNGRVEDFPSEYKERRLFNIWTDAEKDIFREKYLLYPKNFGAIASFLERKSVSDCVQHYYLSKKTENYKRLLKKSGQKSKSGRNKSKTAAPPPVDPSPASTPPGPTIAARFQRDYKPTAEAAQYKPEVAPNVVKAELPTDVDVVEVPPLTPPAEPPAPFVPVASVPSPTVPTSRSSPAPEAVLPQAQAQQVQQQPPPQFQQQPPPQFQQQQSQPQQFHQQQLPHQQQPHIVHKPPPPLKPLMLPHLSDIPIVVIDDSDDSNSGSHFPYTRK